VASSGPLSLKVYSRSEITASAYAMLRGSHNRREMFLPHILFHETLVPLDAAKIVCPGMVEVNLNDGTQTGEGRCIITTPSNESVYATWNCTGEYLAGCKGTFTLLGGTGKFERITGRSEFLIRSDIAAYVVNLASTAEGVQTVATGLAVWPALTYKTP